MNIDEMKDRIARAEEIQRYTENRCEALEKENVEFIGKIAFLENDLNNAKAQIEKMKSCVNCRYCIDEKCPWQPKGCGMKHWELRR